MVTVNERESLAGCRGTVAPEGEIDLSNATLVARDIDAELRDGVKRVIVDLDRVTFMNSSLLGVLVASRQRCQAAGADLVVTTSHKNHHRLLALTELDRLTSCDATARPQAAGLRHDR